MVMTADQLAIADASVLDVLMTYGHIQDQETGIMHEYDPYKIAPYLQPNILEFVGNTPRLASGHKKWLLALASRQQGKSATVALAMYIRTAYNERATAALIADKGERSDELFRHITACHDKMPDNIRMGTISNRESRQLTFEHGGKMKTLTAGGNMVGIGRSYDNLHMSELPFWSDAAGAWNGIYPAVTNRKEACIIMESTPAELHHPSAEWYRDMASEARRGEGRWQFVFAPYFSSVLNERVWQDSWRPSKYELTLLDRYGPKGMDPVSSPGECRYLTLENLAFRRHTMRDNPEIKRYPELFNIWYCLDPITCWIHSGGAAIPAHVLERHLTRLVVPWIPHIKYMEYEEPEVGAQYVIGVDPAGWMGGDHASFQVLKIYADEWGWEQVACFSSNEVDPQVFARKIIEVAERYNNAETIVENNGVGLATLTILEMATDTSGIVLKDDLGVERRYHLKNLYYQKLASGAEAKPGVPANQKYNAEALTALIDALMDKLVIRDQETLEQLQTYKRDAETTQSDKWQILNPGKVAAGRRARHHWDRVSALLWACYLAKTMPQRYRRKSSEELEREADHHEERMQKGITFNEHLAMRKDMDRLQRGRAKANKKPKIKLGGKAKYKKTKRKRK